VLNTGRRLIQERLELWLDWWRDLLLVKVGLSETVTNIDRLSWLIDLARNHSLEQIRAMIDGIQVAGNQLRQNANPQLVLEVLMLSLPETGRYGNGKR
jgi:DNA polymerase III gamma/tau subunit